jgi:hypothetical protein
MSCVSACIKGKLSGGNGSTYVGFICGSAAAQEFQRFHPQGQWQELYGENK